MGHPRRDETASFAVKCELLTLRHPPNPVRILIIEDDRAIATNVYDFLTARGHTVDAAADGVTGLHLAVTHEFDVIVLDVSLPGIDGLKLCRRLRSDAHVETPVLMLTARDTLDDKLLGFESGADDYLVKPFALKELEARATALHKRQSGRVTPRTLVAGALTLDPRTLAIRFAGKDVKLPPKCIRLLEIMMAEPGRVFSRAELEGAIWGEAQETSDTLRSHMRLLRRALTEAGEYDPIETVHGLGYRLLTHARPQT
jgi:DNA-binding response OmpR family regulator